jgi:L-fuconolactonase
MIDAHFHLWVPGTENSGWLDSPANAQLRRPYGPLDYAGARSGTDVTSGILVTANSSDQETRHYLGALAEHAEVAGIVGWADLASQHIGSALDSLVSTSGGHKLVGVRHPAINEPGSSWFERGDVRRGLAALAQRDMTLDLLIRQEQFAAVASLAASMPELTIAVNHLGNPRFDLASSEWERAAREAAGQSNVVVKLSGLVTRAPEAFWSDGGFQPYLDVALDAFGASRIMLGSDWPVSTLAAEYSEVIETYLSLIDALSSGERQEILARTAQRVYRLDSARARGEMS